MAQGVGGSGSEGGRLSHLRAAKLRARATRGALVKLAFGTVFLIGALAHALSPERQTSMSRVWMTLLLIMSTMNVALGLKAVARTRRLTSRAATVAAGAWGVLALVLVGLLLRR
ncbi:MAG TPA: hypothetical protein VHU40_14320 [Polyangia bacterium]|nr:hypothetical protein [Polyangia bacterium]